MTDSDLDQTYSRLCASLGKVGEAQAPLFLSMLCLLLMSRFDEAAEVTTLIDKAEQQSRSAPLQVMT
ncbi:MAG: hypothetical protein H7332_00005 [Bdellovibrionales bacterium]|nr:hypothetical protein [Ramlibacter sp.]